MSELVKRVGDAIEKAWFASQDLPPIEFTPGERDSLANAAIAVIFANDECICPKCGIRHGGRAKGDPTW